MVKSFLQLVVLDPARMKARNVLPALLVMAGASTLSGQGHDHHAAHSTVSSDSATNVTLATQVEALRAATARYTDPANAKRDGFVQFGRNERAQMGTHWYRKDLVDRPLDLAMPSTLQYATIDGKLTLIGVAFTVYQRPGDPVPEGFAGASDIWHTHDIAKLARMFVEDRPVLRWLVNRRIERGQIGAGNGRTQLAMVHAWVWLDNPAGMFADRHVALPFVQAGLPAYWAVGAGENAAWGVATLQSNTCDVELDILKQVAGADRKQRRELASACEAVRAKVRLAFDSRSTPEALHKVAESAWNEFLAHRERVLTDGQLARLASMVEHPAGGAHGGH